MLCGWAWLVLGEDIVKPKEMTVRAKGEKPEVRSFLNEMPTLPPSGEWPDDSNLVRRASSFSLIHARLQLSTAVYYVYYCSLHCFLPFWEVVNKACPIAC